MSAASVRRSPPASHRRSSPDGRYEEAKTFSEISEETGADSDVVTQAVWRSARASALAHAGEALEAERLAREAVAISAGTDFLDLQAGALLALGDVLRAAGRPLEAAPELERARELYARKGNVVAARKATSVLVG